MFYRLMAGRLPFDISSLSLMEAAQRILQTSVPRLGSIDPALSGAIEEIAGRAMEPDCSRRYQSAADLASDLRACLEGRPMIAPRQAGTGAHRGGVVTAESRDGRFIAVGLSMHPSRPG